MLVLAEKEVQIKGESFANKSSDHSFRDYAESCACSALRFKFEIA
jgi:hypothetical protein